jgi:hypothetical protein
MARQDLAVQQVSRAAITPAYTAAHVDGHQIPNDGQVMLHVKSGGTGATVTVQIPAKVDGQAVTNRTYVMGTSTERMIGPFPPTTYNQGAGQVYVDFSSVTTMTLAAIRIA